MWKREKEVNTLKYTNNISFPEACKIIQSKNQFPARSYAQASTSTKIQNNIILVGHVSLFRKHSLNSLYLQTLYLNSSMTWKFHCRKTNNLNQLSSQQLNQLSNHNHLNHWGRLPNRWHPLKQPKAPHHLLGRVQGLLTGDLDQVLLLIRGSSWRKPTQKTILRFGGWGVHGVWGTTICALISHAWAPWEEPTDSLTSTEESQ